MANKDKEDYFVSGDKWTTMMQCWDCVHWYALSGQRCTAFPNGIPQKILRNEVSHKKPYPGDGGYAYEQLITESEDVNDE